MNKDHLTQESFDAMKKRLNIQNEEIETLVTERDILRQNISILEETNKQLVGGKFVMESVIQSEIDRLNKVSQGYLQENQRLQNIIKKLKNGE